MELPSDFKETLRRIDHDNESQLQTKVQKQFKALNKKKICLLKKKFTIN